MIIRLPYKKLLVISYWLLVTFLLLFINLQTAQAQVLYQCSIQPDGSGCWKLVNYTEYDTECDDYYDSDICWVQCTQTDPGCGSAPGQTQPPPSTTCGTSHFLYSECDWNAHQVKDVYQDNCGNYSYQNQHTEPGVCGAPSTSSGPPPPPPPSGGQVYYLCDPNYHSCTSTTTPTAGSYGSFDQCQNVCHPPVTQPVAPTAPTAYFTSSPASGNVGSILYYSATASGTNLSQLDILIADASSPLNLASSWTVLGSSGCSGETCSVEAYWVPDTNDSNHNFIIVINAFDNNGLQCSGNPAANPSFWASCSAGGGEDASYTYINTYNPPENPPVNPPVNQPEPPTEPTVPIQTPVTVPTATISGPNQATVGDQVNFSASATGSNLVQVGIYRANQNSNLSDPSSWTELESTGCSGQTCNLTASWVPDQNDSNNSFYVVVNVYDQNGPSCSGNPSRNPAIWNECANGNSDLVAINVLGVTPELPPAVSEQPVQNPTPTCNPANIYGACVGQTANGAIFGDQVCVNTQSGPEIQCILNTCQNGASPPDCAPPLVQPVTQPVTEPANQTPAEPTNAGTTQNPVCNLGEELGSCQQELAVGVNTCVVSSSGVAKIQCILKGCSNNGNLPDCKEIKSESKAPEQTQQTQVTQSDQSQTQNTNQTQTQVHIKPQILSKKTLVNGQAEDINNQEISNDSNVTLEVTVPTEMGDNYACRWNLNDGQGDSGLQGCSYNKVFSAGSHTVTVYVVNNAGEESERASFNFRVRFPPTIDSINTTISGQRVDLASRNNIAPLTVTFTAVIPPEVGGFSCRWDFGDSQTNASAPNCQTAKTFQSGTRSVSVYIVNNDGQESERKTISFSVNPAPTPVTPVVTTVTESFNCYARIDCAKDRDNRLTGFATKTWFEGQTSSTGDCPSQERVYAPVDCPVAENLEEAKFTGEKLTLERNKEILQTPLSEIVTKPQVEQPAPSCTLVPKSVEYDCSNGQRCFNDFDIDTNKCEFVQRINPDGSHFHCDVDPACKLASGEVYIEPSIGDRIGGFFQDNIVRPSQDQAQFISDRVGDLVNIWKAEAEFLGNVASGAVSLVADNIKGGEYRERVDRETADAFWKINAAMEIDQRNEVSGALNPANLIYGDRQTIDRARNIFFSDGKTRDALKDALLQMNIDIDIGAEEKIIGTCPNIGGLLIQSSLSLCLTKSTLVPTDISSGYAAVLRQGIAMQLAADNGLDINNPQSWPDEKARFFFEALPQRTPNLAKAIVESGLSPFGPKHFGMPFIPLTVQEDAEDAHRICNDTYGNLCDLRPYDAGGFALLTDDEQQKVGSYIRALRIRNDNYQHANIDLVRQFAADPYSTRIKGVDTTQDQIAKEKLAEQLGITPSQLDQVEDTYRAYVEVGDFIRNDTPVGKQWVEKANVRNGEFVMAGATWAAAPIALQGGFAVGKAAIGRIIAFGDNLAEEAIANEAKKAILDQFKRMPINEGENLVRWSSALGDKADDITDIINGRLAIFVGDIPLEDVYKDPKLLRRAQQIIEEGLTASTTQEQRQALLIGGENYSIVDSYRSYLASVREAQDAATKAEAASVQEAVRTVAPKILDDSSNGNFADDAVERNITAVVLPTEEARFAAPGGGTLIFGGSGDEARVWAREIGEAWDDFLDRAIPGRVKEVGPIPCPVGAGSPVLGISSENPCINAKSLEELVNILQQKGENSDVVEMVDRIRKISGRVSSIPEGLLAEIPDQDGLKTIVKDLFEEERRAFEPPPKSINDAANFDNLKAMVLLKGGVEKDGILHGSGDIIYEIERIENGEVTGVARGGAIDQAGLRQKVEELMDARERNPGGESGNNVFRRDIEFARENGQDVVNLLPENKPGGKVADDLDRVRIVLGNNPVPKTIDEVKDFDELASFLKENGASDNLISIIREINDIDPHAVGIPKSKLEKIPDVNLRERVVALWWEERRDFARPFNLKPISEANNFNELYTILRTETRLTNDRGINYEAEDLIETIKDFIDGKKPPEAITRTEGLRDKVIELQSKPTAGFLDNARDAIVNFVDDFRPLGVPRKAPVQAEQAVKTIDQAQSFDELYSILEAKGGITGSDGRVYSAAEIKELIEEARQDVRFLNLVTRTDDLRETVRRLRLEDPCKIGFNLIPTAYAQENPCKPTGFFGGIRDRITEVIDTFGAQNEARIEELRNLFNRRFPQSELDKIVPQNQNELFFINRAKVLTSVSEKDIALIDRVAAEVAEEAGNFDYVIVSGRSADISDTLLRKHDVPSEKILRFSIGENGNVYKIKIVEGTETQLTEAERTALTKEALESKGVKLGEGANPSFLIVDDISNTGYKAAAYLNRFSEIEGVGEVEYAALTVNRGAVINPAAAGKGDFVDFSIERLEELVVDTFSPSQLTPAESAKVNNIIDNLSRTLNGYTSTDRTISFNVREQTDAAASHLLDRIYPERANPSNIRLVKNSTRFLRFDQSYPAGGSEEFEALSRLYQIDPEHVVKPVELIYEGENAVGFRMEPFDGIIASKYVDLYGGLTRDMKDQIVSVLENFHANGFALGDPRLANILITPDGKIRFISAVPYTDLKPEYAKYDIDNITASLNTIPTIHKPGQGRILNTIEDIRDAIFNRGLNPCPVGFNIIPIAYAQENPCKPVGILGGIRDNAVNLWNRVFGGKETDTPLVPNKPIVDEASKTSIAEAPATSLMEISEWEELSKLNVGQGTKYGRVIASDEGVTAIADQQNRVITKIYGNITHPVLIESNESEVAILEKFGGQNSLPRLYEVKRGTEGTLLGYEAELINGPTLYDFATTQDGRITIDEASEFLDNLIALHTKTGVPHNDLNSDNVLIETITRSDGSSGHKLRIIDYGAKNMDEVRLYPNELQGNLNRDFNNAMNLVAQRISRERPVPLIDASESEFRTFVKKYNPDLDPEALDSYVNELTNGRFWTRRLQPETGGRDIRPGLGINPCPVGFNLISTVYAQGVNPCKPVGFFEEIRNSATDLWNRVFGGEETTTPVARVSSKMPSEPTDVIAARLTDIVQTELEIGGTTLQVKRGYDPNRSDEVIKGLTYVIDPSQDLPANAKIINKNGIELPSNLAKPVSFDEIDIIRIDGKDYVPNYDAWLNPYLIPKTETELNPQFRGVVSDIEKVWDTAVNHPEKLDECLNTCLPTSIGQRIREIVGFAKDHPDVTRLSKYDEIYVNDAGVSLGNSINIWEIAAQDESIRKQILSELQRKFEDKTLSQRLQIAVEKIASGGKLTDEEQLLAEAFVNGDVLQRSLLKDLNSHVVTAETENYAVAHMAEDYLVRSLIPESAFELHQQAYADFVSSMRQRGVLVPDWFSPYTGNEFIYGIRLDSIGGNPGRYFFNEELRTADDIAIVLNHERIHEIESMADSLFYQTETGRNLPFGISATGFKSNEGFTESLQLLITFRGDVDRALSSNELYSSRYAPAVREILAMVREVNLQSGDNLLGTELLLKGLTDKTEGYVTNLSALERYYDQNIAKGSQTFAERMTKFSDENRARFPFEPKPAASGSEIERVISGIKLEEHPELSFMGTETFENYQRLYSENLSYLISATDRSPEREIFYNAVISDDKARAEFAVKLQDYYGDYAKALNQKLADYDEAAAEQARANTGSGNNAVTSKEDHLASEVGSKLHDAWRESRRIPGTDQFEPRIKATTDQAWITNHGGKTEVDIANTAYKDLPLDWQAENKAAAEAAIKEIKRAEASGVPLDNAFVEEASAVQHVEWLKRNESWAPPEQKLPYSQLSEEEKEKDRVVVRTAIETYKTNPCPVSLIPVAYAAMEPCVPNQSFFQNIQETIQNGIDNLLGRKEPKEPLPVKSETPKSPSINWTEVKAQVDSEFISYKNGEIDLPKLIKNTEQAAHLDNTTAKAAETTLFVDPKFADSMAITGNNSIDDIKQAFGAKEWLDWLRGVIEAKAYGEDPLSLDFIRKVHTKLTETANPEIGGKIRTTAVVGGDYTNLRDPVTYTPEQVEAIKNNPLLDFRQKGDNPNTGLIVYPSTTNRKALDSLPSEVRDKLRSYNPSNTDIVEALLEDTVNWYNAEIANPSHDPYQLAAELQRRIISIHPFNDVNGRVSRALMDWSLERDGLSPARLAEPGDDILVSAGKWTEEVKKGRERAQMLADRAREMEKIGITPDPAYLLGLEDEATFYKLIYSKLGRTPPPTQKNLGDNLVHSEYEQFLSELRTEMQVFNDYYKGERAVLYDDQTGQPLKEAEIGGLIPESYINLISQQPKNFESYERYLRDKYYTDLPIFRGGRSKDDVSSAGDVIKLFEDYTAIASSYNALSGRSAVSTTRIPQSSVAQTLRRYNTLLANDYIVVGRSNLGDTLTDQIITHANEPSQAAKSPFASTSLDRDLSIGWAQVGGDVHIPNSKYGILFTARPPKEGAIFTFPDRDGEYGIKAFSGQSLSRYPVEREILVPGGLDPASIDAVEVYRNRNIGIDNIYETIFKARRITNEDGLFIELRDYAKRTPDIYKLNPETGKYELVVQNKGLLDQVLDGAYEASLPVSNFIGDTKFKIDNSVFVYNMKYNVNQLKTGFYWKIQYPLGNWWFNTFGPKYDSFDYAIEPYQPGILKKVLEQFKINKPQ